jgi:hypothetical protein
MSNYKEQLRDLERKPPVYNKKSDDGLQWLRDLDNGNLDSDNLTVNEEIQN